MNEVLQSRTQAFARVLEEVPELTYAGNPVLRQQTAEVSFVEGLEIAKRLEDVLLRYRAITGVGRGLAAPQIGESKAVFITYVGDVVEVYLNPKITEKSDTKNFYKELCMSAGLAAADVERSEWITLEWTDASGAKRTEKFEGFQARLLQHEEAHLRGRINLDDAAPQGIELITFDPLKEQLRTER
jgi:peptide deformylase